jgi:membrane fusion protein (multidrug efflux system)
VATPFESSLRSLETSGVGGGRLVLFSVTILLVGWIAWLAKGRVSVYAVSEQARVEVDQTAHPVAPVVGGIVVSNALALGRAVHAGDELLVLDSTSETLALAQERARLETNANSLVAATKELEAERKGATLQVQSGIAAREVARARSDAAKLIAEAARQQDEIVQRLKQAQLASGSEALVSATSADQQRAAAVQATLELQSVASAQDMTLADRTIRTIRLEREIALLRGQIGTSRAIIEALEFEIGRRTLHAAVDGTVADIAPAPKGAIVTSGQRLATIVPPGRFRIVASYVPGEAVGRVRRDCPAVVRLDGFPWAQYGTHRASVVEVASEARDNVVRVELEVAHPNPRLPLTHGLTARVEVEVEEVTPFTMLVRSLGYVVSAPAQPTPTALQDRTLPPLRVDR